MRKIAENTYLVKKIATDVEEASVRCWHDCPKYKRKRFKDKMARVELILISEDEDTLMFACPHCNFKLTLKEGEFIKLSKGD